MNERISNKQLYFIFKLPKIDYYDTAYGINELAKKLERPIVSVKASIRRLGNKEFIVKNKTHEKFLIVSENEMRWK